MAQVTITQLPAAGALTGTESVPIVQNGQTVQTTTGAISGAGALNYPFVTVGTTAGLSQARQIAAGTALSLTDNGAGSTIQLNLTGAPSSLITSGTGIQVKTSSTALTARQITVGGGMTISNADGVSGDPAIGLNTNLQNVAALTGTGLVTVQGSLFSQTSILGTSTQITVTNGDASTGNPTVGLATDPILPGTGSTILPQGTTAQRSASTYGAIRYNTDTGSIEAYTSSVGWGAIVTGSGVSSFSAGSTGFSPSTPQSGGVVLSGILNAANGGTGVNNASSTITLGGNLVLSGAYDLTLTQTGTTSVTLPTTGTLATLSGSETFTNKTISGSVNTLSNIGNSSLTNSSLTIGSTSISLGGTSLTLAGLSSVTVTADPTTALQLATKQYVDGLASTGLIYHSPAQVATTQSLAAQTGGSVTYNNGSSGVGATLTLGVALTTLDGYSLVNGDRILVKDETTQAYNGVYTWATGGTVLTRSTDTDSYGTGTGDLSENDYFFIQNGTVNKGSSYVCTTAGTIVFGTTAITFAQFSTSQVYTGTSPIQVSGTTISLNTVPVASGGTNITSYATGDMLYASASTTLAKLTLGTLGYVMTAGASAPQYVAQSTLSVGTATNIAGGAAGSLPYNSASGTTTFLSLGTTNYVLTAGASAPQYVAQSTLSVGSATNATNTAITANSTNATNYLTFVSATTGNLPQLVNSSISCNPSTGQVTGGISGGAF